MKTRFYEVKIVVSVKDKTLAEGLQEAKKKIESFGIKGFEVKPVKSKRTLAQNSALHLYLTQWADALQNAGIDMRQVIREDIDMPPTMEAMKTYVWKPLMKAMFGKKSTTQLFKTGEIDEIVKVISKTFGERFGLYVPFPSYNEFME